MVRSGVASRSSRWISEGDAVAMTSVRDDTPPRAALALGICFGGKR
jgi:hypothetical protein